VTDTSLIGRDGRTDGHVCPSVAVTTLSTPSSVGASSSAVAPSRQTVVQVPQLLPDMPQFKIRHSSTGGGGGFILPCCAIRHLRQSLWDNLVSLPHIATSEFFLIFLQARQGFWPAHLHSCSLRCSSLCRTLLTDDFHRCFTSSVQMSSGNPLTENHYSSCPSSLSPQTIQLRFLAFQILDISDGHQLPMDDNPPTVANPRCLQQVSTLADRRNVINWMVEDEVLHDFNGLYRHAIHAFPANFRGQLIANIMKATRW
jgi:hypothetical protein